MPSEYNDIIGEMIAQIAANEYRFPNGMDGLLRRALESDEERVNRFAVHLAAYIGSNVLQTMCCDDQCEAPQIKLTPELLEAFQSEAEASSFADIVDQFGTSEAEIRAMFKVAYQARDQARTAAGLPTD